MPGQEIGNAAAEIMFGISDPAGRLPFTLPNIENEMKFTK